MKVFELFDQGARAKWKMSIAGNGLDSEFHALEYTFWVAPTGDIVDKPTNDQHIEYKATMTKIHPKFSYTPDTAKEVAQSGVHYFNPALDQILAQFNLPENTYEFHFSNESESSELKKSEITGSGHAVKVFGVVMQILKDARARTQAEHVLISAFEDEPSRVKLYNRLVGNKAIKKWSKNGVAYWLI
jgi:hypothetical protein